MKYYTPADIYKLESELNSLGITSWSLMQKAGHHAFDEIKEKYKNIKRICVFCGCGNNAGDGYVLAKAAIESGCIVEIIDLSEGRELIGNAKQAKELLQNDNSIHTLYDDLDLLNTDVIVDAILGIGSSGEITGIVAKAINVINNSSAKVVSLDIPSGLNPETGSLLGDAIMADLTITFLLHKICLVTGDGIAKSGDVKVCKLYDNNVDDLSFSIHEAACSYDKKEILKFIKPRYKNSHKGCYGSLLVIAGDEGYLGALFLIIETLLKIGAGVVRVITHKNHIGQLITTFPSVIAASYDKDELVKEYLNVSDSILIGPGLTSKEWVMQTLEKVISSNKRVVLDAGALRLLKNIEANTSSSLIVTPHPGEAADLLSVVSSDVQANRLKCARNITSSYACTCVLKGAGTIISFSDDDNVVCPYGNPGMAVAGMGDVLSAVILCFIAQFNDERKSIIAAVYLHSMAADHYANEHGEVGITPSAIIVILNKFLNKRL
ncbi:MAG: NAD(P)H-hydrate dehydratase [Legionellales bacterium]|jgi:ADP-dependent NAD(P)H-hydrate dehydratase / NAD(P)H-hydrate epimerase|nr:NAD(P)H-hydrate dehydratase [Legionellales bacterium]